MCSRGTGAARPLRLHATVVGRDPAWVTTVGAPCPTIPHVKRTILLLAIAALAASAATACSQDGADPVPSTTTGAPGTTTTSTAPTVTTTTPSTIPSGLEAYDGEGFSVLLPTGWTILDAGDVATGELLDDLAATLDTGMVDAIGAMFEQGGKIFALDVANPDPIFVTNINILEAPLPPFSIDAIESITADQLESVLGATIVDSDVRTTAAGDLVVVRYTSPTTDSEGVSATLLTETTQWAITLSARDVTPYVERFDAIVDSFREG
jgi:hypothetical protein